MRLLPSLGLREGRLPLVRQTPKRVIMFKFLHAADIHLDSPLLGLDRYEGAPVERLRSATRRALENLVNLALDEEVSFVLIAGDLYDRELRDYGACLHLEGQM